MTTIFRVVPHAAIERLVMGWALEAHCVLVGPLSEPSGLRSRPNPSVELASEASTCIILMKRALAPVVGIKPPITCLNLLICVQKFL